MDSNPHAGSRILYERILEGDFVDHPHTYN